MRSPSKVRQVRADFVGGPLCGTTYERRTRDGFPLRLEITVDGIVHVYVARITAGNVLYRHWGPIAVEGVK